MAGTLGYMAGLALKAAAPFFRPTKRFTPPGDFRLETVSAFDDRFDDFWQRLKRHSKKLIMVRDKKLLDWHFHYALSRNQGWITVCEKDSEMLGYAVYLRNDNDVSGLKRVWAADLQALGRDPETVILSLLTHGMEQCKREGIHVFEVVGFEESKRRTIKKLLPWKREYPCWPSYYKAREKSLAETLDNTDCWDPCIIDGDAAL